MGAFNSTLRMNWLPALPAPAGKYKHPIFGNVSAMTDAPELYEFALIGNWPELVKRCSTHPKESFWVDKFKNNAIHLATRRQPPVEAILSLMKANPNCSKCLTGDGLTPLHFAAYCGASEEVITLLVKSHPKAPSVVDKRGRTPLHCACTGFRTKQRYEVIKILLESDPNTAVMPDEKGRTALSLMFHDYAEEMDDALSSTENGANPLSCPELNDYYKITALLLRAAYTSSAARDTSLTEPRFQILHAAVGVVETPPQFVRLLLRLQPDAAREKDSDQNLPLHVAAKTRAAGWMLERYGKMPGNETDPRKAYTRYRKDHSEHGPSRYQMKKIVRPQPPPESGESVEDCVLISPHVDIIKTLLKVYPMAALVPDSNGKLPFHLAMESGKSWDNGGLSVIFQNCKDILDNQSTRFSLLKGLTDESMAVRMETANTCGYISLFWKNDSHTEDGQDANNDKEGKQQNCDFNPSLDKFLKELTKGALGDAGEKHGVQSSMFSALAATLHKDFIASEDYCTESDVMDVARSMIFSPNEDVRESAAKVIGAMGGVRGMEEEVMDVVNFQILNVHAPEAKVVSNEIKHGRACACYRILISSVGETLNQFAISDMTHVIKKLMKDDNTTTVRKTACLAVGGLLARSNILPSVVKDLKGCILKCMKPTENVDIHLNLARGLRISVRMNGSVIFKGKAGLPILDAALLLSVTGIPIVQQAFINFLWLALRVSEGQDGLHEYMELSEGENGRIMMTLVTKVMEKIDEVDYT